MTAQEAADAALARYPGEVEEVKSLLRCTGGSGTSSRSTRWRVRR
jgi:hypothetical protein